MNEREYSRMRAKIETEYEKNLEALDRVYALSDAPKGGTGPAFINGSLANEVRKAVESQTGIFAVRDIEAYILSANPEQTGELNRTSISGVLRRLEADNQILLVQQGQGKRATTYQRSESEQDDSTPIPIVAKGLVVGGQ